MCDLIGKYVPLFSKTTIWEKYLNFLLEYYAVA